MTKKLEEMSGDIQRLREAHRTMEEALKSIAKSTNAHGAMHQPLEEYERDRLTEDLVRLHARIVQRIVAFENAGGRVEYVIPEAGALSEAASTGGVSLFRKRRK